MIRGDYPDSSFFVPLADAPASGAAERETALADSRARPFAFGASAGYLHRASGDIGVVLCGGWGYEAICAHRACVEFGDMLAGAGYPTLRFDYPGTGDAAGDIADFTLGDWIAAVRAACAELRRIAGVRDIVLAGFGFGCLAAMTAAPGVDAIGYLLLAPPRSGRRYIRETQALAAMVRSPHDGAEHAEDGGLSIAGFSMPAALVAEARRLDLGAFTPQANAFVVVAARPEDDAAFLADLLGAQGAAVRALAFRDYAGLMAGPTDARVPVETFEQTLAALSEARPVGKNLSAAGGAPGPALREGPGYVEEALRFADGQRLFGVLCRPAFDQAPGAPAVVMVSVGRNPHTGWRRMSVENARALARMGIASLRFDLGGIGESGPRANQPAQILYSDWPMLDVSAALDLLTARGYGPITLTGSCSGAYAALQVAVADARVAGCVAINLYRLVWDATESVEEAIRFANRPVAAAVGRLFTRRRLLDALTGKVDLRSGFLNVAKRLQRGFGLATMTWAGPLGPRGAIYAEFQRRFGILRARRTELVLGYAAGDDGASEIRHYFGKNGRRLAEYPNVRVSVLENCDHNLTPRHAAAWLVEETARVVAVTAARDAD